MKSISRLVIKRIPFLALLLLLLCTPELQAEERTGTSSPGHQDTDESRSPIIGALLYLPNRVFDLLDIFRFKIRVGPGIAAGARVTEVAELYAGSYTSIYAGFPGPRMKPTLPLPVGLESHNGASASVVDATVDGGIGPDYSPTEVGAGFQLLLLGFDFGIDVVEVVDFVSGIFTIDLRDDDL